MIVACLHTAQSNVALYEAAAPGAFRLRHTVRPDLLARAGQGSDAGLLAEVQALLGGLAEGADAVLLTCSSLAAAARPPALAADHALARAALARGGTLDVILAAPSTMAAARALYGPRPGLRLVALPEAWARFLAGDVDGYLAEVSAATGASGAHTVALGQSSMAPVAAMVSRPVLTVPSAAFAALEATCG
ncbi:Asp/Glu racemase [Paroceanicella profunda]|uniref:Asp/Glu racemase n=1 Tax=Paroceanicella profunda TaxID=2579971 RepID=A0A5B8FUM2_9RHOB|nr:Asp/Glu racemase [Paroceanicella profunda]QDL90944.1 Asp/Glu racemase [Paroceanicella profunda]